MIHSKLLLMVLLAGATQATPLLAQTQTQTQTQSPSPSPSQSPPPSQPDTSGTATPSNVERVERVETIIVKNPKNAAVMSYDTAYDRLKRLQDSKLDRVRLEVRVKSTDKTVQASALRVAIVTDAASVPLVVKPDGLIALPLRDDLYKVGAEILTNQPKGTMTADVSLGVAWSGGQEIPYFEVEETVRQLQMAGKDLMGWFGYMLFFPSLQNVEVPMQYPEPRGQTLKVMKDGRVLKTFTANEKGLLAFKLDPSWSALQPTLVFSEVPPKL